jgi:hypothetical protein
MAFDLLYTTCLNTTHGDEQYCRQVINTLAKLSRERAVMYTGGRGVKHVIVLPNDDNPLVDVIAAPDKSMFIKIKSLRYAAQIRYVYDGQLKPVHAVVSNLEVVNMLNTHISFEKILNEIFTRVGNHVR